MHGQQNIKSFVNCYTLLHSMMLSLMSISDFGNRYNINCLSNCRVLEARKYILRVTSRVPPSSTQLINTVSGIFKMAVIFYCITLKLKPA